MQAEWKNNLKWIRLKRHLWRAVVFSVSCLSDGQYNEPLTEVLIASIVITEWKYRENWSVQCPQIKFTNKLKLIIYRSSNIQYFCAGFIVQVIGLGIWGHFCCLKDFLLHCFWICMFTGVSTIFQESPESYFILCVSGFSFFVSLPSEVTISHYFLQSS